MNLRKIIYLNKEIKEKIDNASKLCAFIYDLLKESQSSLDGIAKYTTTGSFAGNNKSLLEIYYTAKEKVDKDKNTVAVVVSINRFLETDGQMDYSVNIITKLLTDINIQLTNSSVIFIATVIVMTLILSILVIVSSFIVIFTFSKRISSRIIKILKM